METKNKLGDSVDNRHIKKSYGHLRPEQPEMIYQIIKKESNSSFPVEKMCQTLDVSRSGNYAWNDQGPSEREKTNEEILKEKVIPRLKA